MKRDMKTQQCKFSVAITWSLFTYEQFSNITISDRSLKMRFKEEKHLYGVNMLYFLLFGNCVFGNEILFEICFSAVFYSTI